MPLRMVHERQFIFMLKALSYSGFGFYSRGFTITNSILIFLGFSCSIDKLKLVYRLEEITNLQVFFNMGSGRWTGLSKR